MTTPSQGPSEPGHNDWPEPEVKRYPGVVAVVGIVLATALLWSGCALVSGKIAKALKPAHIGAIPSSATVLAQWRSTPAPSPSRR